MPPSENMGTGTGQGMQGQVIEPVATHKFEQPTQQVEAPPVQQSSPTSEVPADIQPATPVEESQGPAAIMGDLPSWDTVLSMEDFQSKNKGEQNQFREKWLRQMESQNPDVDPTTLTELRKYVYTKQGSDYETVYGKSEMQKYAEKAQEMTVERAMEPPPPELTMPSGPSNIELLNKLGNPFEILPPRVADNWFDGGKTIVEGETRLERHLAESVTDAKNFVVEQGRVLGDMLDSGYKQVASLLSRGFQKKGVTETLREDLGKIVDPYGAIAQRVEDKGGTGWYVMDSYLKAAQVMGAGTSFTIGGLEGAVEREREIARKEGRAKFYHEMDPGDRRREIEKVMFSEGYVGMDERVADMIRDEMMPMGMKVEQMDDVILKGIQAGDLPQIEFFRDGPPSPGYQKVEREGEDQVVDNPFAAMGKVAASGFDTEAASKAFWNNVSDWDNIQIRDASTLRKLTKGKTYEEKYGFWKGLAANVVLSIAADPLSWPLIMYRIPTKIATKFATSNIAKALAGKMSLRQSIEMLENISALSRAGAKLTPEEAAIVEHAAMLVKGFRAESEFLGKEGQELLKLLDQTEDLIGRVPTDDASRASARKVEEVIDNANSSGLGLDKDEVFSKLHNIPAEGTSMGLKETPSLSTAVGRASKYFDTGITPAVAPDLADNVAQAADKIPDVARTTGGYDMSHIVNSIPDAKPTGAKIVEEAAEIVGDTAEEAAKKEVSTLWNGLGEEGKARIPGVDSDGISVLDDTAKAAKDQAAKAAKELEDEMAAAGRETQEQAIKDAEALAAKRQKDLATERMRVHDPETRKTITDSFDEYERAMDDVTTPPPAQQALYENLVRTWKKFHPGDDTLDEFNRVLDERRAIKAGEVVPEGTGSDLLPAPKGPVNVKAQTVEEFKAAGGKVQKVAPVTEEIPQVVGGGMRASDKATLATHGIEISDVTGAGQKLTFRRGLGYSDQAQDTLKRAADDAQAIMLAGKQSKAEIIKNVEKQFGKGMNKAEKEQLKQVLNEVTTGDKTPAEIDEIIGKVRTEGEALQGKTGKKLSPSELKKEKRRLANEKRKAQYERKTPDTTILRNADGSYDIVRTVGGKRKRFTFNPSENNGGEYLGSIFGQAQKFWDDVSERLLGVKRGAAESATEIAEDAAGLQGRLRRNPFSIEDQFRDFPRLGKTIKNIYSVIQAVEEFTLDQIKAMAKIGGTGRWSLMSKGKSGITDIDLQQLPLLHENIAKFQGLPLAEQHRLKPFMDAIDRFYEFFKKGYKERGVDVDFAKHLKEGIIDANKKMVNMMQGLREGTIKTVGKKQLADLGIHNLPENFTKNNRALIGRLLKENLQSNEQILGEMKNFKYINIPHAMWFEQSFDKAAAMKAFRIANAQKRQTFRIQDLIDAEAIDASQVNLFDMMAAYGRRAAHDFAMLDVKNEMRRGGQLILTQDLKQLSKTEMGAMIKRLREQGWKRADPRMFPLFDRGYIHPAMAEWLNELKITGLNANNYDKFLSTVKGFQFANPLFLPLYDLQQAAAARGMLGMFNLKAWGEDMLWAAKLMKNKPQEYWDILHFGQQSQPMALPYDEYMSKVAGLKDTNAGSYLWNLVKRQHFKGIYNVSWDSAWNMDKFVRFTTTRNAMRRMGMDTFEAAQYSSLVHSDYGNVPVKARRSLNRFMFTPTFKITMFRSYGHQLKNAVKVPLRTLQGRGGELTQQEKAMAKAGYGLVSMLVGLDLFMTGKGYERDQFARRYYKNVEVDGNMKEDVAVFSSPLNMVPKYWQKMRKVFNEGYKDDKLGALWNEFKWDAQPVYRIAVDMYNNKKDNGDPIYEPYIDSDVMRSVKLGAYATQQVFQIIKTIGMIETPEDQQKAWDLYRKDIGNIFAYTTKPNSFQYLRDPSAQRYIKKVKKMQREYKRIVQDMLEDDRFDEERALRGQQEMMRRAQAMVDLAYKAETVNDRSWLDRMKGGMVQ